MDTGVLTRRHDAAIEDIERSMDVLNPFALRSGAATHGESLRELKQADDKSLAPAKNLIIAVSALINAVDSALLGDPRHARAHLCAASASLGSEATPAEPDSPCEHLYSKRSRDGLAPWQIRCVTAHIEEHLSESIHCADLSTLIKLSLSHFMRAFRDSLGCSPHVFLMKRRMERAQGLMLATSAPLGQIALECGLADQSHLSRLFQRFVGESPAAWRRARIPLAYSRR
jgi:AraC family transcriptional regulator